MADVFISYAREDQARAAEVARALEAHGLDVFWDTEIPPGQTWADVIEAKLTASKAMVVLWSAASAASQWVREEARMGRDRAKLIPAQLDATPPPFGFGEVQTANLTAWRGDSNDANWRRFLAAVEAKVGVPSNGPRPFKGDDAPRREPTPSAAPPPFRSEAAAAESPVGYVIKCLRHYVNASGRARRAEYWWWTAFVFAAAMVTTMVDVMLTGFNSVTGQANTPLLSALVSLGCFLPGVCVTIRRFHDVGLSGWWIAGAGAGFVVASAFAAVSSALALLLFCAVVGAMIWVTVRQSQPGANRYGPNPKGL